jgi:hypothetical protein
MHMDEYRHHVSGFFADRQQADGALARLVDLGLPRQRVQVLTADTASATSTPAADSKGALNDILVDGAIGTAVGTGVGALAELALVAANVSLFVASPLIAPLALLGWGATLGGFIGAAAGTGNKDGNFSALIRDAVSSGHVVLVAETRTEQETALAREVIQASVGEYEDVSAA